MWRNPCRQGFQIRRPTRLRTTERPTRTSPVPDVVSPTLQNYVAVIILRPRGGKCFSDRPIGRSRHAAASRPSDRGDGRGDGRGVAGDGRPSIRRPRCGHSGPRCRCCWSQARRRSRQSGSSRCLLMLLPLKSSLEDQPVTAAEATRQTRLPYLTEPISARYLRTTGRLYQQPRPLRFRS